MRPDFKQARPCRLTEALSAFTEALLGGAVRAPYPSIARHLDSPPLAAVAQQQPISGPRPQGYQGQALIALGYQG